jgi:hypothetical protein
MAFASHGRMAVLLEIPMMIVTNTMASSHWRKLVPVSWCVRDRQALRAWLAALALLSLPQWTHAEWGKDAKLSGNGAKASLNENMGRCLIAEGNTLHTVWTEAKGADSAIHYRRSADRGATWSEALRISPKAGLDSFPLLAKSGATLHLVFLRKNGTPQAASYYRRSTDEGKTWDTEVLLGATKWWPGVAAAGSMVYVSLNTVHADDPKCSVVYFRRSTDNGKTWEDQQPISTAPRRTGGRAEDPAIMANGKHVQLVWNDNRDVKPGKGMAVYYRRSSDMGKTWGRETALTTAPAYTYCPSIYLTGSHADVVYGDRQSGHYDIYRMHSPDLGDTWSPKERITKTTGAGELYPAIVRDGSNVHLAWFSKDGISYKRSRDAGKTWDPVVSLSRNGAMPFLATAGEAVYVIFRSQRDGDPAIYFKCDPTGNQGKP